MSDHLELHRYWNRFLSGVETCTQRLLGDLEECWQDSLKILEAQSVFLLRPQPPELCPGVASYLALRTRLAREGLIEPLDQFTRKKVYPRALLAWQMFEQSLADLVLQLPERLEVPRADALTVFKETRRPWFEKIRLRWRRRLSIVPLRSAVEVEVAACGPIWFQFLSRYLLALLTAAQHAGSAWRLDRAILDYKQAGRPMGQRAITARRRKVDRDIAHAQRAVTGVQDAWRHQLKILSRRVSRGIIRGTARGTQIEPGQDWSATSRAWRERWQRQEESVQNANRLEIDLEQFERGLAARVQELQNSIGGEFGALQGVIDKLMDWLAAPIAAGGEQTMPAQAPPLVPIANRQSDFENAFQAELDILPQQANLFCRLRGRTARRQREKFMAPRQLARDVFDRQPKGQLAAILGRVGERHSESMRVLERAREVVNFAAVETAEMDPRIRQEASQNAISLLTNQRRKIEAWKGESDRDLPAFLANQFVGLQRLLALRRFSFLSGIAEYGLARYLSLFGAYLSQSLRRLLQWAGTTTEKLAGHFLKNIGWKATGEIYTTSVSKRPLLPAEFTAEVNAGNSSALYHRLFRQAPVDDPRFLQGREYELEALVDARQAWDAGRPLSLLVVGARGSGKTSLINCILKQSFGDLTVWRTEFSQRVLSREALHAHLARMAGMGDPSGLEEALSSGRRVIVLEELERTFLRQVGRYEALRALMQLISATSRHTMWIVAINWNAFNLLRTAVGLESAFSHRLRIGVVDSTVLRAAILARHYYSGLRVEYPPLASQRRLLRLARLALGRRAGLETTFFDALAVASGGLFRAAINIWLGQVERLQSGVLTLRPFQLPNLAPVIDDLDADDLFTLVAISQHGSLTVDEHALVFQKEISASRAQLDELKAREVIEPDPAHPGLRIRPEAVPLVMEAIFHRGLV